MPEPITPLTPDRVIIEQEQAAKEGYLVRILIGFDMFINVIANGHPDETISSRAARASTEGKLWGKIMSRFLDIFQTDHGADAEAGDVQRADTVKYLENKSGILK